MTDDTARAVLAAVPDHVWRYQQGSEHLLGCCIHTDAHLTSARPSGLLREALALLLDDAFTAEREDGPAFARGIRHAVRVIEDRALAADEPGLDVHTIPGHRLMSDGWCECAAGRRGAGNHAARLSGRAG